MYLLCEPACSGAHEGAYTVWFGPPVLEVHPQCDTSQNFSPLDSRGHPDGWLGFCLFIFQLRDMRQLPPLGPHDLTAVKGRICGHSSTTFRSSPGSQSSGPCDNSECVSQQLIALCPLPELLTLGLVCRGQGEERGVWSTGGSP